MTSRSTERTQHSSASAFALVSGFTIVLLAVGLIVTLVLGLGLLGVAATVVVVGVITGSAYVGGDSLALALTGAVPIDPQRHARLDNLADGLCATVGVPKPRVLVVDCEAANAFACGRGQRRAAVVVTSGLLERVSRIELEGVLARELQQIKSGEAHRNSLLVGFVALPAAACDRALRTWWSGSGPDGQRRSALGTLLSACCVPLTPLAPMAARVLHVFVRPDGDGLSDLAAVGVTRYPPGLAGALDEMREAGTVVASAGRVTAHLWVAEPLPPPPPEGFAGRTLAKLSTHLPLDQRVDVLREL